jgi:hypothetical protein
MPSRRAIARIGTITRHHRASPFRRADRISPPALPQDNISRRPMLTHRNRAAPQARAADKTLAPND